MALKGDDKATLFSASMAGTLRLIFYMALCGMLMVFDHQGHWLAKARYGVAIVVEPLYRLAGLPARLIDEMQVAFASRARLTQDNRELRQNLMLAEARLNRLSSVLDQNRKLKQLLDTRHALGMSVQLARLIDVDLGPYRNRVVINAGAHQGVHAGQVVIDAHGVMGQVVEVLPDTCVAMLITDPNSQVPVVIERTGQRSMVHGSRIGQQLLLPNIPLAANVKVGDRLLTSGLGGRYPPGFPVGTIEQVGPDPAGMFLVATAKPAAHLRRSSNVLLLKDLAPPVGPPAPAPPVGPPADLAPHASTHKGGRR